MTIATLSDFFNGRIEQEVLEPVVILPVEVRNSNTGNIALPIGFKWTDFEYMEGAIGIGTSIITSAPFSVNKAALLERPSGWAYSGSLSNTSGITWELTIAADGVSTAYWSGEVTGDSVKVYPKFLIGYRRRLSSVGLDELMSSMGLPNLCDNADLSINQRNFNGNWANLTVGAYGYDQWMKVSDTHMAYVIEEGFYKPNSKYTVTKDDVLIGEFVSPNSGHFAVSVPFATSGKFDIYMGRFKRPWHPVQDGLSRCQRYYQSGNSEVEYLTSVYNVTNAISARGVVNLTSPVRKIVTPSSNSNFWFYALNNRWMDSGTIGLLMRSKDIMRIDLNIPTTTGGAVYQCVIVKFGYVVDATITLAEVNGQIITIG